MGEVFSSVYDKMCCQVKSSLFHKMDFPSPSGHFSVPNVHLFLSRCSLLPFSVFISLMSGVHHHYFKAIQLTWATRYYRYRLPVNRCTKFSRDGKLIWMQYTGTLGWFCKQWWKEQKLSTESKNDQFFKSNEVIMSASFDVKNLKGSLTFGSELA